MKAWMAAPALLIALITTNASATDGNGLLEACQNAVRNMDAGRPGGISDGYCYGVVYGVASTMLELNLYLKKSEQTCFPEGFRNDQSARVVADYLKAHPASLHRDAAFLAMAAFQSTYPCK